MISRTNKVLSQEKFAHHLLLLLLYIQRWKTISIKSSTIVLNQTAKTRGLDVINTNGIKYGLYGDLVYQDFPQFNQDAINNQDPQSQIEERRHYSAILNFMSHILPTRQWTGIIQLAHIWVKDYVKYDVLDYEPVLIFLSGSGSTSKSHLVKVIYKLYQTRLLYHCQDPGKSRVLLLRHKENQQQIQVEPPFTLFLELNQKQRCLV